MSGVYITDNNIVIDDSILKKWKTYLNQYKRLYIYAMTGMGKSVNAFALAKRYYSESIHISAEDENFFQEIRAVLKRRGTIRVRTLLILDDLQWILKESDQESLLNFLLK